MTVRQTAILLLALVATAGVSTGCASSPDDEIDPFEMAEDDEEDDLLADEPERSDDTAPDRGDDVERPALDVPEAAGQPARPVNARSDGWDMDQLRVFEGPEHVIEGASRWDGVDDTSFSAAVDTDDSHLYFWIEVTDDEVVDAPPTNPLDGVEIRLRDPRLDDLLEALPEPLREQLDVEIEAGYILTPDGRAAPTDHGASVPEGALHSAADRTDDGYVVEAAFSLEALPYLADIPLDEIAFRIDVLDADPGDDAPTKRLSAIVDDDRPRFAVTGTDGTLPASAPADRPPRPDALGVWHRSGTDWTFQTLEYVSDRWQPVDELEGLADELVDLGAVPEACDASGTEHRILDAYEYDGATHRVVLTMCGPEADGDCPSDARSQVAWTHLERDRDQWRLADSHPVFDQPLEQCLTEAPEGQPRHHDFTMLPFDRVGNRVWGIGYQRSFQMSDHELDERSVRLVDPRSPDFVLLDHQIARTRDSGRERVVRDNRIYLTDLEGGEGLDVCKVEDIKEQVCQEFQSGCETRSRGHEVIAHIDLWDADEHRFEDYLLTRHDNCRGSTQFEDVAPGFKIVLFGDRLALLPTRD